MREIIGQLKEFTFVEDAESFDHIGVFMMGKFRLNLVCVFRGGLEIEVKALFELPLGTGSCTLEFKKLNMFEFPIACVKIDAHFESWPCDPYNFSARCRYGLLKIYIDDRLAVHASFEEFQPDALLPKNILQLES